MATNEDRQRAKEMVSGLLMGVKDFNEWVVVMRYFAPWLAANDPRFLFELLAERTGAGGTADRLDLIGLKVVPK